MTRTGVDRCRVVAVDVNSGISRLATSWLWLDCVGRAQQSQLLLLGLANRQCV